MAAVYGRVGDVFVVVAIGPEAHVNPRRFRRTVDAATNGSTRSRNEESNEMKLSKAQGADKVLARQLKNPRVRAEWERTAVAHVPSRTRIVEYRAQHELSQTALARQLGMKQPAVARLEAGEHNPSFDTLARLSSVLGIEFHIAVTPEGVAI